MHVSMHVKGADLDEAFRDYIERRLRFGLGRFGDRVGRVTVRISAEGPAQNRCRITAELRPWGRISVNETDADLFTAIDRATGRLGWLFGRELDRVREARIGRESIRIAA